MYIIRDRKEEIELTKCDTYAEAFKIVIILEENNKRTGKYKPNSYEVVER